MNRGIALCNRRRLHERFGAFHSLAAASGSIFLGALAWQEEEEASTQVAAYSSVGPRALTLAMVFG